MVEWLGLLAASKAAKRLPRYVDLAHIEKEERKEKTCKADQRFDQNLPRQPWPRQIQGRSKAERRRNSRLDLIVSCFADPF
jgi:hypothetical protein